MLGEKYFLWNSIPNILIILGLIYYLHKRKNIGAVVVAMFVYLSLHGGYAIFAAATGDKINTLNTLHYQASDLGVKFVAACFLVYCGALFLVRMQNPLIELKENIFTNRNSLVLLVCFILSSAFYLICNPESIFQKSQIILKELFFAACMWIGIYNFSIVIKQSKNYFKLYQKEFSMVLIPLSFLMVLSGFYEVFSGVVWAGSYYAYGFSYRTSATLFNPNIVGLWCGIVAGIISIMFHLRWITRVVTFVAMFFLAWLLILCSSRSGLILTLVNFFIVTVILLKNRKVSDQSIFEIVWPPFSFVLALTVSMIFIELYAAMDNVLYANSKRFMQIPSDLFWTFMVKVFIPALPNLEALMFSVNGWFLKIGHFHFDIQPSIGLIESLQNTSRNFLNSNAGSKMLESVNGRISQDYTSDNSFSAIYASAGIFSLIFWISLWGVLFVKSLRKLVSTPGILSAHTMGALVFCFASGFFLRTPQLFPVWIFISMFLGACLCWWSTNENTPDASIEVPAIRSPA